MIQLNFLEHLEPIDELRMELRRIEESGHKVRRGTYSSINRIGKAFTTQEQRINELEHKLWIMEKCLKELLNDRNPML